MIDAMTIVRAVSLLAWVCAFVFISPAIFRVLAGRPRFYDMLEALIGGVAALIVGFNLRFFVGIETRLTGAGLHVFSIMLAASTLAIVQTYRGVRRG